MTHKDQSTYRIKVTCDDSSHSPRTVAAFLSVHAPRQEGNQLVYVDTPWLLDENAQYGKSYNNMLWPGDEEPTRVLVSSEDVAARRRAGLSTVTASGWALVCPCGQSLRVGGNRMREILDTLRDNKVWHIRLPSLRVYAS